MESGDKENRSIWRDIEGIRGFYSINVNISGLRWISVDLERVKLYCGFEDSRDLGDYEGFIGIFGD